MSMYIFIIDKYDNMENIVINDYVNLYECNQILFEI